MGRIHFDEKRIRVNGILFDDLNAIDSKTKFVLAEEFVDKKDLQAVKLFLMQIKRLCYKQILEQYKAEKHKSVKKRKLVTFVCDGCPTFKTACHLLFGRVARIISGVPIACKKYGLAHNNNHIERYNREIKRRMIVIGSFQTFQGVRFFCSLRRIIHNFVNSHSELQGKTPAEAAGIHLQLGGNKLLGLIRHAAKKSR